MSISAVTGAEQGPVKVAASSSANALTYLDSSDPFYVNQSFPRLTTPQWVGEPGVDAVVILAVDDMTDSGKYETFLRPILNRLKQIDGLAPVSIMTRSVTNGDPLVQTWLKEGLSLEAHTVMHPCPLFANGDFQAAATNYYSCIDSLSRIPGNKPVAFRMPCCDSMDSTSPRFFAELFSQPSREGNFLSIDSSVMDLLTTNDPALPRNLVLEADGTERFRKYVPTKTNGTTRVSLGNFATTIENYPYPYIINRLCWEFPCVVPSDWEAFNSHGATNQVTIADWKAALDAVVLKKGAFTMIFHPYNWIRNDQLVDLIDYTVKTYGSRVKFLTFREALARLNHNLLADQPVRAVDGGDNGVRILDVNGEGFMDVVVANSAKHVTRVWESGAGKWTELEFPAVTTPTTKEQTTGTRLCFGLLGKERRVVTFFRDENAKGAWAFEKDRWRALPRFFDNLNIKGQPVLTSAGGRDRGVRLRDVDNDGQCELLVANETQNAIFRWSDAEEIWTKAAFGLPEGTSIVNAFGQDNGLRFVDLNGDGYDDVLFSNQDGYSVYLFIAHAKQWLGWEVGWSYKIRAGRHGHATDIPMVVRGGPHPDNGVWFKANALWAQNEDTSSMPDKVARISFQDLQLGQEPNPKSTDEALSSFHIPQGMKIELVASEPDVIDPVAFDWGPDGKLWVVEMRDYPLGIDGKGKAGGVVRVLEDTHGTGHYDKSTVFMDNIGFPNGIMPWAKGVLISAAPDILYAEDTDGDGKADVRKLLYTGFHEGNQQHRVNGFEYGLDNWIYAANGGSGGVVSSVERNEQLNLRGHDLRIRPDEGLMELQPGATQFGRHRNDWGDWFGNDNSRWLWHYYLPEHYLARNPHLAVGSLIRQLPHYPNSSRIFTLSKPQQRFNWPGALFEVTSACSATPYRDEVCGAEYEKSVFICEPANNVIHREVLETDGVSFVSHRPDSETNSEFIASSDNWCRPTMVKTGPDGAIYFADMYRLVIEHPEYFPDELKHRPDLRAGEDKGRIYRVYPKGAKLRPIPRLDQLSTKELVAALDTPNGWQRDTVQRMLVQSHSTQAVPDLENLFARSANPKARLQALCTLAGLQPPTETILIAALQDPHWAIRRQALILAEARFGQSSNIDAACLGLEKDPDLRVRYQLAFSLGEWKGLRVGQSLGRLMTKDGQEGDMQVALLSSAPAHLGTVTDELSGPNQPPVDPSLLQRLVDLAAEMKAEASVTKWLTHAAQSVSGRYASWQFSVVAGLVAALDRENVSLSEYQANASPGLRQAIASVMPVFVQARELAGNADADERSRLVAIGLIARASSATKDDVNSLGRLLDPQNTTPIQAAALSRLRRLTSPEVAQVLLKVWRGCGVSERQSVLNVLFSRSEWTEAVLTALEQGRLSPGELGTLQQQKLLQYPDAGIRSRARRVFTATNSDRKKVVAAYQSVAQLQGNRFHGRELFSKNCAICHRIAGQGQSIGPDLGTVADKPVSEIVTAILDPNQAVDPAYVAYTAVTKDDRELTGVLASESPNSVSLRLAGGSEEQILRSNLKEMTSSGRSLMPEGFESGLNPQDIADLIAFVLNPAP